MSYLFPICKHKLRAVKRLKTVKMSSNGVAVAKVLEQIQLVQGMIDINASSLNSLRTQFSTNSDLIQHEIRTLEGKLVKLFSRQLVVKQKCNNEDWNHNEKLRYYPKLEQWLQVVGINEEAIKNLEEKCCTIEGLLSLSDDKVRAMLENYADGQEESRRLIAALKHLQAYTERQKQGHKDSTSDIYWESWDTGKTREKSASLSISPSERSSRSSVTLDSDVPLSSPSSDAGTEGSRLSTLSASDTDGGLSPKHNPQPAYFMKRSVSDDANLGNRIFVNSENPNLTVGKKRGGKLEPVTPLTIHIPKSTSGDISLYSQSDSESDHNASSHTISSPSRYNVAHYGIGHTIKHRFSQKTFIGSLACDYCHKILLVGKKCKECKQKFHKKCAKLAPPVCKLPKECGEFFTAQLRRAVNYRSLPMIRPQVKRTNSEPSSIALQVERYMREQNRTNRSHGDLNTVDHKSWSAGIPNEIPSQFAKVTSGASGTSGDSCSTSSSTSSPPSSPLQTNTASLSAQEELDQFPDSHFSFTDVSRMTSVSSMQSDEMIDSTSTLVRTESVKSRQSNNTTTSNDSTLSGEDVPGVDQIDSQISDVDPDSKTWGRKKQRGSLMSEWVIPFEELEITWSPLGSGRFGKVYRGHWHGEVAVKMIEIENPTEQQLNAFKFQVGTFRKTRHENVVLFMGACMDPPKLAIITSMCRGFSLYTHIHVRKDNFQDQPFKIAHICTQISQGMGYLHARGIVHTDLRSKNVFLELNNRVVITDFGLFSVAGLTTKSVRQGMLMIPEGWLPYLAPEILRSLTTQQDAPDSSQFTFATDMYAFGTVWYEMCSGSWPFKKQIPEAIIWQVGKGVKQSLANVIVPREVKDTLTVCWAFEPEKRPTFSNLLRTLERLPKQRQRLHRSPSQPCTVGRGADGLTV